MIKIILDKLNIILSKKEWSNIKLNIDFENNSMEEILESFKSQLNFKFIEKILN